MLCLYLCQTPLFVGYKTRYCVLYKKFTQELVSHLLLFIIKHAIIILGSSKESGVFFNAKLPTKRLAFRYADKELLVGATVGCPSVQQNKIAPEREMSAFGVPGKSQTLWGRGKAVE